MRGIWKVQKLYNSWLVGDVFVVYKAQKESNFANFNLRTEFTTLT